MDRVWQNKLRESSSPYAEFVHCGLELQIEPINR